MYRVRKRETNLFRFQPLLEHRLTLMESAKSIDFVLVFATDFGVFGAGCGFFIL